MTDQAFVVQLRPERDLLMALLQKAPRGLQKLVKIASVNQLD